MTLLIEQTNRRHYLVGDTYPIKHLLKGAGCHWDADRRAWWTGDKAKAVELAAKAAAFAGAPKPAAPADKSVSRTADILKARVEYKSKAYYAITDRTRCGDGIERVKLAFRDGSTSFWAVASEVRFVKFYDEPQSIARIEAFVARQRQYEASHEKETIHEPRFVGATCDECGTFSRHLTTCSDSSGIVGRCCGRCASTPAVERSFA